MVKLDESRAANTAVSQSAEYVLPGPLRANEPLALILSEPDLGKCVGEEEERDRADAE